MSDSDRLSALMLKVGELERKLDFVMQHLKLQYHEAPQSAAQTEALKWVRKGNKIEAIKVYRELTGVGLKEAKDAVEALERQMSGR